MNNQTNQDTSPYIEQGVAVQRLNKDLMIAAATMTATEARFLVDQFYTAQDDRIRYDGQVRSMSKDGEPTMLLGWLGDQSTVFENQIKRALNVYTDNNDVGIWMKSLYGIGPIMAAGFLAHIDIEQAPTAGHIWSYAGLTPTSVWMSAADAARWVKENGLDVRKAAAFLNRNPDRLHQTATTDIKGKQVKLTATSLAAAMAKRPWNAELKKLCFKFSEVMKKFSNVEECYYGNVLKDRKHYEWEKNLNGDYFQRCQQDAETYGNNTEAIGWVRGCFNPEQVYRFIEAGESLAADSVKSIKGQPGSGVPMLPPAHIERRAGRYAAKLFLSHLHEVWYETHFKRRVPNPFVLEHGGHVHRVQVPNYDSPYAGQTPSTPFRINRRDIQ